MKLNTHAAVLLSAMALGVSASAAAAHEYTYLEGGYVDVDTDAGVDDSGGRVKGSFSILPQLAVIGEYADVGDLEQTSAGVLYHTPLNNSWDLVGGVTFENIDVGPVDDSGFGARAGVHWRDMNGRLQLEPEIRYLDIFDDTFTSLRLGATYEIAPRLDLAGAFQGGDDDRLELGARYRFGS